MKYIFFLFMTFFGFAAIGQKIKRSKEPMTEVSVAAKWYVIVNKHTGRQRKALCSLPFNTFELCQHRGICYSLLPDYKIDTKQTCQCEDMLASNTEIMIRVSTKQLHLTALNAPNRVKLSGDSIKIRLRKTAAVSIPLNYKGASFKTIKNFIGSDSSKIEPANDNTFIAGFDYINFVKNETFIPSKEFPGIDSTIFALRQNKALRISLVGVKRVEGSKKSPDILSIHRTQEVQRYLIRAGIAPNRVKVSFVPESRFATVGNTFPQQNKDYVLLEVQ